MKRIDSDDRGCATIVAETLKRGGIVVVPTDTMYGLSAALSNRTGYQRIIAIKRCEADRKFLYLASSVGMVETYIDSWGCVSRDRVAAIWPAPLTGVFRCGSGCPSWLGETIAFRIPALAFLRRSIELVSEPVLSTSVNTTGEPPVNDIAVIEARIGAQVDLIVRGAGTAGGKASTLVDFTGDRPVVVREGAYAWDGGGNPSK